MDGHEKQLLMDFYDLWMDYHDIWCRQSPQDELPVTGTLPVEEVSCHGHCHLTRALAVIVFTRNSATSSGQIGDCTESLYWKVTSSSGAS